VIQSIISTIEHMSSLPTQLLVDENEWDPQRIVQTRGWAIYLQEVWLMKWKNE
jgi:hypothetical protein